MPENRFHSFDLTGHSRNLFQQYNLLDVCLLVAAISPTKGGPMVEKKITQTPKKGQRLISMGNHYIPPLPTDAVHNVVLAQCANSHNYDLFTCAQ